MDVYNFARKIYNIKTSAIMKQAFVILLFAFSFTSLSAKEYFPGRDSTSTVVPLTPAPTPEINPNGDGMRSPARPVYASLDGHTVSFNTSFAGCEVILIENDGFEVFTDYVDSDGFVIIPDEIIGIFELQLIVGDFIYAGEILLN